MPAAKTQWRLTITATQSGEPGLANFELRDDFGGADLTTGGTATASSIYSGTYPADNAFDGSNTTSWFSSSGFPQWIQYEFASPVDVVEYLLRAPYGYPIEAPKTWTLAHNDGSGGWTEVDAQTDVDAWSADEQRVYTFGEPPAGSDLGELVAHHLHPHRRRSPSTPFDRDIPVHHLHPQRRAASAWEPVYLHDYGHFPVRLNGRECPAYYGPSGSDAYPWTIAGQPATSDAGRIFYHPMRWRLHWLVAPGIRTLSVPVVTNYSGGVRPRLELRANAALGVAADYADSGLAEIPHGFADATYPPGTATDASYELGTRFRPSTDTRITALRFYRPAVGAGAVTGRLWNAAGTLLASAAYTLSGTGWQTVELIPPVEITAGQDYIASFNVTAGDAYAYQHNYFNTAHTVDVVTALAYSGSTPNGVFSVTPGTFPTGTASNALYFADVVFEAVGTAAVLEIQCNPTLAGLVAVDLVHNDFTEGRTATFGTITAT